MANLTDSLIRAVQGTDPQNLMEYITRQKIYDSRFWKEECFGMTTADVLEKSAKTLKNIGGTFGGNHRPTKFLCLVLKLLQLQPDADLVEQFITQKHFKYVRALGAFYLRLTGRPADIYELLEPLYADFGKLRVRGVTEWRLQYMDEFVDELLTQPFCCGIALPRLPFRQTLQQDGLLEEGPRATALQEQIGRAAAREQEGGEGDGNALEALLRYKVKVEKSPAAIALWEKRQGGKASNSKKRRAVESETPVERDEANEREEGEESDHDDKVQVPVSEKTKLSDEKQKKRKKPKYGNLFKSDKTPKHSSSSKQKNAGSDPEASSKPEEGSDEYWNEQRAKLGLKPLR